MHIDYRNVIAEAPTDAMGSEFQEIFGRWVNETNLGAPSEINQFAFHLFKMRLELSEKYNTYFSKQVTEGGKELWKDRFSGVGNMPCYSFASFGIPYTRILWNWSCEIDTLETPTGKRIWDLSLADYPHLPMFVDRCDVMDVSSHVYHPRFAARIGGSFECRRILYGFERNHPVFLFEHPRNQWIPQIKEEAMAFWNAAFDSNNNQYTRFGALASWEWLWYWMNPFMRSGALTGDALSLVMQKRIGAKTREFFYHQDCEALLLPFDAYVVKRINDMTFGFCPFFDMNVA